MKQTARNFARSALVVSMFFALSAHAQKNVKVSVTLFPAGDFVATTQDITGSAKLVGPNEVKAENIKVNLNTLKTGIGLRDNHAKDKYLETKKFPEAVLVSATGKDGKGQGVLRIKGKESKVNGTYALINKNQFLKANFKTKLSEYGISDISYKGVGVEDEIVIEVVVPVTK